MTLTDQQANWLGYAIIIGLFLMFFRFLWRNHKEYLRQRAKYDKERAEFHEKLKAYGKLTEEELKWFEP